MRLDQTRRRLLRRKEREARREGKEGSERCAVEPEGDAPENVSVLEHHQGRAGPGWAGLGLRAALSITPPWVGRGECSSLRLLHTGENTRGKHSEVVEAVKTRTEAPELGRRRSVKQQVDPGENDLIPDLDGKGKKAEITEQL